jgi:hypothetical protein
MELTIEQSCPSCGAPIELHEGNRLIKCPFCDGGNYQISGGLSRLVLPDKAPGHIPREDLAYVPYLRFKGNIFSCLGNHVDYKVIDTTHQGIHVTDLPLSLGLRSQAMKIFPVTDAISGRFFPLTEKIAAIFTKATELASIFSNEGVEPLYHRAFIGETISCIYLPVYLQNGSLYDAVLNRPLCDAQIVAGLPQQATPCNPAWAPRFLATVCPHCAETLTGEPDSLMLACHNCDSLWAESNGAFHPLTWEIVRSDHHEDTPVYLPFWKIRPKVTGIALASFGDFLRLTNQPVVVKKEHDVQELCFWIPAFKIRPNIFLQLAKRMTIVQARIPKGGREMAKMMSSVTLPSSEAVQSLKTVLADSTMDKRHFLPRLPTVTFQEQQTDLVYLPFISTGFDLVQEQTSVSVPSTVLQFGRSL